MKLSTKSRYALEAMLYMAVYSENEPMSIKQIAKGTNITEGYLEQIFFRLRKSKLLNTTRGAKGGFLIAGQLEQVTVGMVVRTMEGTLVPVVCVEDINLCKSKIKDKCATRGLWQKVAFAIDDTIDRLTLADLKEKLAKERLGI